MKELKLANIIDKYKKEYETEELDEENFARVPIVRLNENHEVIREIKVYKVIKKLEIPDSDSKELESNTKNNKSTEKDKGTKKNDNKEEEYSDPIEDPNGCSSKEQEIEYDICNDYEEIQCIDYKPTPLNELRLSLPYLPDYKFINEV